MSYAQSIEIPDTLANKVSVDTLTAAPLSDGQLQDTTTVKENQPNLITIQPSETVAVPLLESENDPPIRPMSFFAPAALMIYGLSIQGHNGLYSSYNIHQDVQSVCPGFFTPIDDYIDQVPLVMAFVTGYVPGTKARHSNGRRLWMFVQAQVLTSVGVAALKYYSHELRPNGSDYLSFPSGHTAQAFMGAALFDLEYPGQMKGLKIGLYSLAGLTGMLAMMNDRHWASDVLFGAGVGMLSVRLLYLSERHFKKKQLQR
ncbi:MAG TPA: phosphatase PAP2 family protein [Cytophagaceae bacterium]|nr:phosphatase PAP2 family protein [Cytophagaceae bacterium]